MARHPLLPFALILAFWCIAATAGRADVVRYHYTPTGPGGQLVLQPTAEGAPGEWRPWAFATRRSGYNREPKANRVVTYVHPSTGRQVNVPIAFPEGTPTVMSETGAITYAYTLYTIRVEFLVNGSVDVVYNSGIGRPPSV
jgi:hypothetical protein